MPDYSMHQEWQLGRASGRDAIRVQVHLGPDPRHGIWNNGQDATTPRHWNARMEVQMPGDISEHTIARVSARDRGTGQAAARWLVERGQRICEDAVVPTREEVESALTEHVQATKALPLLMLNTTVATADGSYELRTVSLDEARELATTHDLDSAVGHEPTAAALSGLLGRAVPVNRQQATQAAGQTALVFKLNARPPEGVMLDRAELDEIGYTLKVMYRTA